MLANATRYNPILCVHFKYSHVFIIKNANLYYYGFSIFPFLVSERFAFLARVSHERTAAGMLPHG